MKKEKYNPILLFIWIDADDGTYAIKKVLIQNSEQLDLVREEIHVSSLFTHPNLLPLLDHAIIAVKGSDGSLDDCVYQLICPCGTLCPVCLKVMINSTST
ncbi:unnamed protein product [Camellia sinensis]